ncbi:MAG: hypothetical protein NT150_05465 [Bacteroidetes bacterium]|nr:hypothetical protein [Bacteroidota bacterium]
MNTEEKETQEINNENPQENTEAATDKAPETAEDRIFTTLFRVRQFQKKNN